MSRILRVYDDKGDFTIEIPDDAKVTFGYFNPGKPDDGEGASRMNYHERSDKKSSLRIYGSNGKDQLACFTNVKGFRDESIKLTRLREEIRIVSEATDDGEGLLSFKGSKQRTIKAHAEPDTYQ